MSLKKFTDEFFNIHHQDKILGQGGQGVVFRTKDPDIAIKLVTDENGNPISDSEQVDKYSQHLNRLRLLPLAEDIKVSVPVALLKDNAGYVMQLLSEMVPFSDFWLDNKQAEKISNADIPKWLSEIPEENAKKIVHYSQTGGLRRRLIALYKCAEILAQLHGGGFVYGDISPNNIFISEDLSNDEVWLIDADNLRFEVLSGGKSVYTPKYGAPELVQGIDEGRAASDCYAFAVVAFYMLALIHPFIGKKADGSSDDDNDWADDENDDAEGDIEEKAYAGLFPWVDDLEDDSNSTDSGLPRQLLLTETLKCLFEKTFSDGRKNSKNRPSIYHWPESFAQAADNTIQCSGCNMSWYYNIDDDLCPYCGSPKPPMIMFQSYQYLGESQLAEDFSWSFIRELSLNNTLIIPERIIKPFSMMDSDLPVIEISINDNDILLKKTEQCHVELFIAVPNTNSEDFKKIFSQIKIPLVKEDVCFWLYAASDEPRLVSCLIMEAKK